MRPLLVFFWLGARPYAVNVLAAALDSKNLTLNIDVRFTDSADELSKWLLNHPERTLVAWSFFSPEAIYVYEILNKIRNSSKKDEVLHVVGGPHATALPEEILERSFDFAAAGDGERSMVDLATVWLAGGDLTSVHGLAWQGDDGRVRRSGPAARDPLDRWPAFAHRLNRFNPIEVTRGCVYACRFCQTPFLAKARFRHRSVADVRHHVRLLRRQGLRDVRFVSPSALSYGAEGEAPNLDAVDALLSGVRAEMAPGQRLFFGTFPSEARPEHLSDKTVRLLKKHVDNDNLAVGAQSGSDQVLAACNRGHTVADIHRAVEAGLDAGFAVHVDIIFGLPGETPDDLAASFALCEKLAGQGARIRAHAFLPLPGTPFAGKDPVPLHPDTRLALERLATRGGLWGQWKRQAEIAADLARRAGPRGGRRDRL